MSPSHSLPGLFITGTDTGVGKTFVAAGIARALRETSVRVGVYKPAATGCRLDNGEWKSDDAVALWEAAGRPGELSDVCPQCFGAPAAPPVAAAQEGREVHSQLFRVGAQRWFGRCDFLLIEGIGGLLCPLSENETVADFAADIGFPLVIVARLGLGTLNHTLLTLEVAAHRGLPVAGVVLNSPHTPCGDLAEQTNPTELCRWVGNRLLAVVPFMEAYPQAQEALLVPRELRRIDWRWLASQSAQALPREEHPLPRLIDPGRRG